MENSAIFGAKNIRVRKATFDKESPTASEAILWTKLVSSIFHVLHYLAIAANNVFCRDTQWQSYMVIMNSVNLFLHQSQRPQMMLEAKQISDRVTRERKQHLKRGAPLI